VRIALPGLLFIGVVEALWPQAMAAIDAPTLWKLGTPLQTLLVAGLVYLHLRHLLPAHPRAVAATSPSTVAAGGTISLVLTHRATDRYLDGPYMSTLPLPAGRQRQPERPGAGDGADRARAGAAGGCRAQGRRR